MNLAWTLLIIAGLLEVGWAIGLKYTNGFDFRGSPLACVLTLAAMIASMWLLSTAVRTIPIGTGYAIWTGIGAVGAAALGMALFREPVTLARIGFLAMVVGGIVGLKLVSPAHAAPAPSTQEGTAVADSTIVFYVGTYTGSTSKGIYRATLDPKTGEIKLGDLAAAFPNPSFLAAHPKLPVIYAISEVSDFEGRKKSGGVGAFLIGNEGKLTPLGTLPSGGDGPAYVSITPDAKTLFVANYGSGSIASYRLNDNGSLAALVSIDQHTGSGRNKGRQDGPHAHSILPDLNGDFAIAADLGTDRVYVYKIDCDTSAITRVSETPAEPGSGPRHIAVAPDGNAVYVVDELSNNVTTFTYQPSTGLLSPRQTLATLPEGYAAAPSAVSEVAVHPSGKFLYVANRGHDSIAVFAIDPVDATLTVRGHVLTRGKEPRHFAIDPSGRFLIVANQKSDSLVAFTIDPATGDLKPAGTTVTIGTPACIRFVR